MYSELNPVTNKMKMMMPMIGLLKKHYTSLWFIFISILFHSYTASSDLIVDSLDKNNNHVEIDEKIWNYRNNYDDDDDDDDDDMLFDFFDNVDIIIYCNNNDDYIPDTSYCNPIDHNVNSSSFLSATLSNITVDNKCNLRSAWHTCISTLMLSSFSCMIMLPKNDTIYMDVSTYGSLVLHDNNHIYINGQGSNIININHFNHQDNDNYHEYLPTMEALISYSQVYTSASITTLILYDVSFNYFHTLSYGSILQIIGNCSLKINKK